MQHTPYTTESEQARSTCGWVSQGENRYLSANKNIKYKYKISDNLVVKNNKDSVPKNKNNYKSEEWVYIIQLPTVAKR